MGFLSIEEIQEATLEEVEDNEFEDEISEEWVNSKIEDEYEKLKAESRNWKSPTDTEKLVKAFDELCRENIIALHKAGYTTSDGESDVVEVETELRKSGVVSDGYCFYHEQDLARAILPEDSSLTIAFNKLNNSNAEVTIQIGKRVVKKLKEHDFDTIWNETATRKIEIPNFKWEKIYNESDEDISDSRKVIELMTK